MLVIGGMVLRRDEAFPMAISYLTKATDRMRFAPIATISPISKYPPISFFQSVLPK
jgi:hypothetical protein